MTIRLRQFLGALFFFTPLLPAASFHFSGSFTRDDEMRVFEFSIASSTVVTMQSWAYGGPTDPITGDPLVGGFASVLSVFDAAGNLSGGPDTGGVNGGTPACGPRGVDPATNFCLDGYIQEVLGPGIYRLVLTQFDNLPVGTAFSDGFTRAGQGNFTGRHYGPGSGRFYDLFGNPRSGRYVITLDGEAVETAVQLGPISEPATWLLMFSALAVMCYRRHWILRPRH